MEIIISVITLAFMVGVVFIRSFANGKMFEHFDGTELNETAGKNAEKVLDKYDIKAEEETDLDETSEEIKDYVEEDDDDDEEADEYDDEENETISKSGGRVYEDTSVNLTTSFKYEALEENKNIDNENEVYDKISENPFIKIVKGNNEHFIKTGKNFGVKLSKNLYTSKDIVANCAACYEATKLGDAILKKFIYKVIPILTIIPAFISQFSWFGILMYLLGVLPISNQYMLYFSIIALASALLTMINFIYYNYLAKETMKNMQELNIIDDKTDLTFTKKTLIIFALADVSKRFYLLRWFLRLALGYKV